MREQIKEKVLKLMNTFVDSIEAEHRKFIDLQKSVSEVVEAHRKEESNRKVAYTEKMKNLDAQKQKFIDAKSKTDTKISELQEEISRYNKLSSEMALKMKTADANLKETEAIKKKANDTLLRNKKVESAYKDKMEYMKEEQNKLYVDRKAVSERERECDLAEKRNKKKEEVLAEKTIEFNKRKEDIALKESQLKLKQGETIA